MMKKIRIAQVGLGPLGQKIAKFISERPGLEITAGVDSSPDKAGKDFGAICGIPLKDVQVSGNIHNLKKSEVDVVLLTTVSDMKRITPQIEEIVGLGLPVISTCEELSYPWKTSPDLAARIDRAAVKNNVAVLGTGVNPGFLMDFLPCSLTAVSQHVESVKVSRIQDASFRRGPFQQKIGAGLSLEEFEKKRQAGTLRHVGLTESLHMIANSINWKLDSTEDILSPIVSEKAMQSDFVTIKPGDAAGVQQIGMGYVKNKVKITLFFRAAVGEPSSYDSVEIEGNPRIVSRIDGGVNGDIATCAISINAIKGILTAKPGLRTMTDMPVITFFS
jgi:4-hydroxy-tetrahydrodipicolinate reductase